MAEEREKKNNKITIITTKKTEIMDYSIWNYYRNNAPVLKIKENAKEVIFTTYSVMCDNKAYIRLKKNEDGEFQMTGMGRSLSNWQMEYKAYEIERAADEKNWSEVIKMINSGTAVIGSVQSR